jgi:hypothetical protein
VFVIIGIVVRDPGYPAVDVRSSEVFIRDLLARGGLDQGRPADENGPVQEPMTIDI